MQGKRLSSFRIPTKIATIQRVSFDGHNSLETEGHDSGNVKFITGTNLLSTKASRF